MDGCEPQAHKCGSLDARAGEMSNCYEGRVRYINNTVGHYSYQVGRSDKRLRSVRNHPHAGRMPHHGERCTRIAVGNGAPCTPPHTLIYAARAGDNNARITALCTPWPDRAAE